jgi:hypothetical protein
MTARITALTAGLALALGGGSGVASALAHGAAAHRASHAGAAIAACHRGVAPADRYVTFGARMSLLPGTASMAIRFDMYERLGGGGGGHFYHVLAPGLESWHTSAPGIMVFSYNQSVTNLPAPASFRARVSFRWRDAGGHVIHRARRRTGVCQMPDMRATLVRP